MSTFSGIQVGLRALETQRKSLDVTGHNIANSNNEDYNKQRAVHSATYPYTKPGMNTGFSSGQMGTGVEVKQIERVKDQFVSGQIFKENQSAAFYKEMSQGLEKIEYILNEPSDSGISSSINEFWNSLQDLSNNPNDTAARNMVRENAKTMIDAFQSVDSQLKDYQSSINDNLSNTVDNINNTAEKIADLNEEIISVNSTGQNPNDLLDQRDRLYKELNQLINVQSREDEQGNLIVTTDGRQIVNGDDHYELEVVPGTGENADTITQKRTGDEITPTNGKTAAMMQLRDEKSTFYRDKLEKLAEGITTEFNSRHSSGYDIDGVKGENFFNDLSTAAEGVKISQMSLTNEIAKEDGLDKIAAGNYSSDPVTLGVSNVDPGAIGDYTVDIKQNDSNSDQWDITISDLDGNQLGNTAIDKDTTKGIDLNIDASGDVTGVSFVDSGDGQFDITPRESGTVEIGTTAFNGSGDNASYLAGMFSNDNSVEIDVNGNPEKISVEGYFRTIVSSVGAESQRSAELENNQQAVLDQLTALDRSVSGVSLDEEMANLIKYQQAYNSAAKYITKTDEILQTLVNMI